MKRIFLVVTAIVGFASGSFAQSEELKSAQAHIDSKNYIKALDEISKAKKAVSKLVSDNLASVLPAEIDGYTMQNEDNSGMGMSQGISVQKRYIKPVAKTSEVSNIDGDESGADHASGTMDTGMDAMMQQPELIAQITTDMMMAGEVMNAHSSSDSGYMQEGTTALRIKGYRALLRKSEGDPTMGVQSSETVQVIVGGAFVNIDARSTEAGLAEKMANAIDFTKLKSMIGE